MDPLAEKHKRDFDELRSSGTRLFKIAIACTVFFTLSTYFLFGINYDPRISGEQEARRELEQATSEWAAIMLDQHDSFAGWLDRHGLAIEQALYSRGATRLLVSAASLARSEQEETSGFFTRAYISFHLALSRLLFFVIASMRMWLFVMVIAFIWRKRKYAPYTAANLLGETGNGRLFYSGIRVALDQVDDRGVPSLQVTGLACPATVSIAAAKASAYGKVLAHYNALNDTTLALSAVLLAHPQYPAFVASREEATLLTKSFVGAELPKYGAELLIHVLELHHEYSEDRGIRGAAPDVLAKPTAVEESLDVERYVGLVQNVLHRVVTPMQRKELGTLSAAQIATAVLAMECGKVLTYAREANRWVRRSSFPQLNARAILHSIPSFQSDYSLVHREEIRRALVYSSRSSVFAPVRFPLNLNGRTRALRQWMEVQLAGPHELQGAADEVELFGLLNELHQRWVQRFFDQIMTAPSQGFSDMFLASGSLLFVPVQRLLEQFHVILEPLVLRRLEELVFTVHQRQKLQTLTLEAPRDGIDGTSEALISERFLGPIGAQDISNIAECHGMRVDEIRAWSVIRVILNSQAWLARRVGDYSVPQSSLIFAVFQPLDPSHETNAKGLMGRRAMVPLRTTKLLDRFGRGWQRHFVEVQRATMAETPEDFQKRLNNIEDKIVDISEEGSAVG